jgi:hypothetical protein
MPCNLRALKGRDKPLDMAEATGRGGQLLVISPLQGLLRGKDGALFATQAVGLGFVSWPLWGSNHCEQRTRYAQSLKGGCLLQTALECLLNSNLNTNVKKKRPTPKSVDILAG